MEILLNGEPCRLHATRLDAALEELGYAGGAIATAVNGSFVPAPARGTHALRAGDRLEVVSPRQGG